MQHQYLPVSCKPNDKVAIIAPAGPFREEWLHAGCNVLREWGLEPVYDPHIFDCWGYLAGQDYERTRIIKNAFEDEDIRAVICARGGYGVARLLENISPEIFIRHPKRFFGFSDITFLHVIMNQFANMITFHSPMIASSLFLHGTQQSRHSLKQALFAQNLKEIIPLIKGKSLQAGQAQGRLLGGNLSLLASTLGTPWQIDPKGAILFIEDVNEAPYSIDRMWHQLRHAGILRSISGLVIGDFGPLKDQYGTYDPEEFWCQRLGLPPNCPTISGVPVGHIHDHLTLPLGANVRLDAEKGSLKICESSSNDIL